MSDSDCSESLRDQLHDLRGALAVIKNDLTFLDTILPSGETDRPQRKCEEIARILDRIEQILGSHGK